MCCLSRPAICSHDVVGHIQAVVARGGMKRHRQFCSSSSNSVPLLLRTNSNWNLFTFAADSIVDCLQFHCHTRLGPQCRRYRRRRARHKLSTRSWLIKCSLLSKIPTKLESTVERYGMRNVCWAALKSWTVLSFVVLQSKGRLARSDYISKWGGKECMWTEVRTCEWVMRALRFFFDSYIKIGRNRTLTRSTPSAVS